MATSDIIDQRLTNLEIKATYTEDLVEQPNCGNQLLKPSRTINAPFVMTCHHTFERFLKLFVL